MNKSFISATILILVMTLSFSSCMQKENQQEGSKKIENTLISVSFWKDSLKVDPAKLLASLERLNEAIDSIGYPDAGYKLWLVQNDTASDARFMVHGYWPDQEVYTEIHNHDLYKNANELEDDLWNTLSLTWYDRFTRVK